MQSGIQSLRRKNGFSQAYVASVIGVSRPKYISIEKGESELTITQLEQLADLYNMSTYDILNTLSFKPEENFEKFREVFLYILEKVGNKPNVGKTVLYKLLYYSDFDYYENTDQPLMGLKYMKNWFGPTPVSFHRMVKKMEQDKEIEFATTTRYFEGEEYEQTRFIPLRWAKLDKFLKKEKELLDYVLKQHSNKTAKKLSEESHQDPPWIEHKIGEIIDYDKVFRRKSYQERLL